MTVEEGKYDPTRGDMTRQVSENKSIHKNDS
jgi:hypothetical protein